MRIEIVNTKENKNTAKLLASLIEKKSVSIYDTATIEEGFIVYHSIRLKQGNAGRFKFEALIDPNWKNGFNIMGVALIDSLKNCKESVILESTADENVFMKSNGISQKIGYFAKSNTMFQEEAGEAITVSREEFSAAVDSVIWSVSDDEAKWAMNHVLITKDEDDIKIVATNGRTLALNTMIENCSAEFSQALISRLVAENVSKYAAGNISITNSEEQIPEKDSGNYRNAIKSDRFCIANKNRKGFPSWKRVIPEDTSDRVVFEIESDGKRYKDFVKLCKDSQYKDAVCEFDEANNALKCSHEIPGSVSGEYVECSYNIVNENCTKENKFKVNMVYFADAISRCSSKLAKITMGNRFRYIPIKVTDGNSKYMAIVMPMNLPE